MLTNSRGHVYSPATTIQARVALFILVTLLLTVTSATSHGRDAMIAGAIDVNATATTPFLIGLEKGVPYTAIAVNSLFCGTNHIAVLKTRTSRTSRRASRPHGVIR